MNTQPAVGLTSMVLVLSIFLTFSSRAQKVEKSGGSLIKIASNIETSIIAEPLTNTVNTPFVEYGPTLTKDGKRLYFSRQGSPDNIGGAKDEDIWFSEFDNATQEWREAKNMGPPVNNLRPNFIGGVGVNGDTLLLGNIYPKDDKKKSGLAVTIREGDNWSIPAPVWIESDYNFAEKTSFDLSTDRKSLIIAQKKTDTKGGLDLYVSFRSDNPNNPYTGKESINLGSVINTAGDEISPFLAYDNKTLYFASSGHDGYGKFDIFVSRRLDDTWTNWSNPENLGPGINSVYDDTFFGFTPRGRYAYYSRGLTSTNSDIYRLDMTYLFNPGIKPRDQMKGLIDAAQIGQSIVLDSIFSDNEYEIRASAKPKLERIVYYLKIYGNYVILISTHSNVHGSKNSSQVLSDTRAVKIRDYLVGQGVSKEQLEYRGYGEDIVANMDNLPTLKMMKNRVAASVEFRFVAFTKKHNSNSR